MHFFIKTCKQTSYWIDITLSLDGTEFLITGVIVQLFHPDIHSSKNLWNCVGNNAMSSTKLYVLGTNDNVPGEGGLVKR